LSLHGTLVAGPLPSEPGRDRIATIVNWNQVVWLGLAVTVASLLLGRGGRTASEASLERRVRWAIRLALGYAAVLLLAVLIPLGRFAWATWVEPSGPEQRALLLAVCLASAFNLVLGFLTFGMAPAMIAFRFARRLERVRAADGAAGAH
jgi:hypothetical protein